MVPATQDRIGRLRLVQGRQPTTGQERTGRSTGDPATRLQLSRLLEGVDLHPSALSPHAILIARRLQTDSLPDIRARPPLDWQRDVQRRLDELSRRAYRPASQPVPLQAESVLFADPSELLACLTRDVLAGVASERWYWRQTLSQTGFEPAVVISAHWCEHAQWLPAAVAQLGLDDTLAAVSRLNQRQAGAVVQALHQVWTLPDDVLSLVATAGQPSADQPPRQVAHQASAGVPFAVGDDEAPWKSLVAPPSAGKLAALAPQQQYLVGLAWTLARRPDHARSRAFAAVAARWLRRSLVQPTLPGNQEHPSSQQTEALAARFRHEPPRSPVAPASEAADRPVHQETAQNPAAAHSEKLDQSRHSGATPSSVQPPDNPVVDVGETDRVPVAEAAGVLEASADGAPTGVAGVLFLVNLLRWLDLPDSWPDDPWMSGWSLLEALGRGLLGAAHEDHAADALWPLLRRLDGRDIDEPPGAGLAVPETFALPAAWLGLLGSRAEELVEEPGRRSDEALLPDHVEAALSPAAAGWLRGALPFVRTLLSGLPGLADVDDLAAALLQRSGQVRATRTHLDLYLPLDAASLPVRQSGLDLDPGWIPTLGRVVQFHFV